jgi:aspartate 1-decarboxylase
MGMMRMVLKSKIHRARVTETNLNYIGSVTIDEELMEAADIIPGERVQILNINTGDRLETYAMPGRKGSGEICLNGAAARAASVGDLVIIISYAIVGDDEARSIKPKIVFVDDRNRPLPGEVIG